MTTTTDEPGAVSRALPPEVLAENFERRVIETTRRCIAMRRHLKGSVCRWRRAARTGPNSELGLVFVLRPGQEPTTEVWPFARIEELAAAVSDEEVYAVLARCAALYAE